MAMELKSKELNLMEKQTLLEILLEAFKTGEDSPVMTERELIELIKSRILSS